MFNLEHLRFTSYCKFPFETNVILKDLLYRCIIFESDLNYLSFKTSSSNNKGIATTLRMLWKSQMVHYQANSGILLRFLQNNEITKNRICIKRMEKLECNASHLLLLGESDWREWTRVNYAPQYLLVYLAVIEITCKKQEERKWISYLLYYRRIISSANDSWYD